MSEAKYYLKPNVVIEALFDRWYAWAHLISPVTGALNIKDRHIKIMRNYVKNPKIHAAAVKKPEMLGGPFIDYDGGRVDEIKELLDFTLEKRASLLELAEDINKLNQLLKEEAKGQSLDALYEKIPDRLRGTVELVYDLNNNPNFRFFESLLYQSEFYQEDAQSFSLQVVNSDTDRSFVLSTPRLDEEHIIHCKLPFKHAVIDELLKMKLEPGPIDELAKTLEVPESQLALFESFFTETAPEKYKKYEGEGIRTRYFGHATVLAETKDVSIIVDPVISYGGYDTDVSRYTINDLPDQLDYILITHNHQDHVLLETLLQLRHKVKKIIVPKSSGGNLQDPDLKLMLNQIGFDNVIELGNMEKIDLGDCVITGLPFMGEHSDLDIRSKLCHHISYKNKFKVLFMADSCNVEPKLYERIQKIIGDIDVLFLGMECDGAPASWLYGPLFPEKLERSDDQSRRLAGSDFRQGLHLVETFKPKDLFVYAMGMEPWLEFISSIKYTDESKPIVESNKLLEACKNQGVNAERLFGEKTIEYHGQPA